MTTCVNICDVVEKCETLTVLAYNPVTHILTYVDEAGNAVQHDLTMDINVGSIGFDPVSGDLTLTETGPGGVGLGQVHMINIGSPILDGVDTPSVDTTVAPAAGGGLDISSNVRLSATPGNTTVILGDGVYTPAPAAETALSPTDSSSIAFGVSGTANHNLTAVVKHHAPAAGYADLLGEDASGLFAGLRVTDEFGNPNTGIDIQQDADGLATIRRWRNYLRSARASAGMVGAVAPDQTLNVVNPSPFYGFVGMVTTHAHYATFLDAMDDLTFGQQLFINGADQGSNELETGFTNSPGTWGAHNDYGEMWAFSAAPASTTVLTLHAYTNVASGTPILVSHAHTMTYIAGSDG